MAKKIKIDILSFLSERSIKHSRVSGSGYITLETCPYCGKSKKMGVSVADSKNVSKGFFKCFSGTCVGQGDFAKLVAQIEGIELVDANKLVYSSAAFIRSSEKEKKINFVFPETEKEGQLLDELDSYDLPELAVIIDPKKETLERKYLMDRGMSEEDIQKTGVMMIPFKDQKDLKTFVHSEYPSRVLHIARDIYRKKLSLDNGVVEHLNGSFQDIMMAKGIVESSRLIGRVIFPCGFNGRNYGYVARKISNEVYGPKVLNSSGAFTSSVIWNYDNVKRSRELIITEGIFDALSYGIDRSVSLLGKSPSKGSDQIKLLKKLNPEIVYIALDAGAEKDALTLYKELSKSFDTIRVVEMPHSISTPIAKDIMPLGELLNIKLKISDCGEKLIISSQDLFKAKMVAHLLKNENIKTTRSLVKQCPYTYSVKSATERILSDCGKNNEKYLTNIDNINELAGLNYDDANDYTYEELAQLIDNSVILNEVLFKRDYELS